MIELVHDTSYHKYIDSLYHKSLIERQKVPEKPKEKESTRYGEFFYNNENDTYFNKFSSNAARLAV